MKRTRLVLLVALGLPLGACYGAPRSPHTNARSALDRLREQTDCSRAVQGEAALAFSGDGRRLRGKVLYLASAPEKLRFDVFSSFGVTLSTLTSNGERFSLYNLEERSFIYGPAKTCNVQKFTQVPVSAEALVELLRGRPPVLRHAPEDAQITFRKHLFSRGQYELEISGKDETSELMEIGLRKEDYSLPPEKQRLRLLGVQVVQAGETLYEVRLSDYRPARRASQALSPEEEALGMSPRPPSGPACEAELPGRLEFYVPKTGYELVIENEEVLHNPQLSAGSFEQSQPQGVSVSHSDCD